MFFLVLPVAVIGSVFWYGWGNKVFWGEKSFNLKEQIIFNVGPYDFGTLRKSGSVFNKSFHLINKPDGEIYVSKVYTDCDCLSVVILGPDVHTNMNDIKGPFSLPKEEYGRPVGVVAEKGRDLEFIVFFNPSLAKTGSFKGAVYFEAKNPKDILKLEFKSKII